MNVSTVEGSSHRPVDYSLHLMLAIQKAEAAGFTAFAASLRDMLRCELAKKKERAP